MIWGAWVREGWRRGWRRGGGEIERRSTWRGMPGAPAVSAEHLFHECLWKLCNFSCILLHCTVLICHDLIFYVINGSGGK